MRIITLVVAGILIALLAAGALPTAALGDNDDDTEVTGIVVSVGADGSFQFREFSSNLIWSGVLRRDVKIRLKGGKDRDERRYRLTSGDIVEIEGRLLSNRSVLVKKIQVLAHTKPQDTGIVLPQPGQPVDSRNPVDTRPAPGLTVPAIVKTIGIGAAVKAFAPGLNNFINKLLQARDAQTQQTTKVVPILSIKVGIDTPGQAAIGAAQVSGPKASVDKVQ
ncbi:MAG: hypothetical protein ACRD1T_12435, partial [Acidimicrobiia bacterium]